MSLYATIAILLLYMRAGLYLTVIAAYAILFAFFFLLQLGYTKSRLQVCMLPVLLHL